MTDKPQIQLDQFLKNELTEYLQTLEKEVERYFLELSQEQEALVRNAFCTEFDVSNIPDDIQFFENKRKIKRLIVSLK